MKKFVKSSMVVSISTLLALSATVFGIGNLASASSSKATKSPILVGGMDSLNNPIYSAPETQSGLKAGIDDVNAHGGVNGHPLKLDFCNTNYTANLEYSC